MYVQTLPVALTLTQSPNTGGPTGYNNLGLVCRGMEWEWRKERVVKLRVTVEGQYSVCVKAQQRENALLLYPFVWNFSSYQTDFYNSF